MKTTPKCLPKLIPNRRKGVSVGTLQNSREQITEMSENYVRTGIQKSPKIDENLHLDTTRVPDTHFYAPWGCRGTPPRPKIDENLLKYCVGISRADFRKYLTPYCSQAI